MTEKMTEQDYWAMSYLALSIYLFFMVVILAICFDEYVEYITPKHGIAFGYFCSLVGLIIFIISTALRVPSYQWIACAVSLISFFICWKGKLSEDDRHKALQNYIKNKK